MKAFWYALVALLLAALCAVGCARLFSRLSGVDLFAAVSWSFSSKQYPLVLGWGFFYLLAFAALLSLLEKPFALARLSATHEGALLGYAERASVSKLYDPVRREYKAFRMSPPVPAAGTFDDAFDVVVLYRPLLSGGHYQRVAQQSPWTALFLLFFLALLSVVLSMMMYKLADLYVRKEGLDLLLSHRAVLAALRQAGGPHGNAILAAAALVLLVPAFAGGFMEHRLTAEYAERFKDLRKSYRDQVLAVAAPGAVLKGRVLRRDHGSETESSGPRGVSASDRTVRNVIYTVEFPDLIRYTPVYLRVTLRDLESNADIGKLDRALPPEGAPEEERTSGWKGPSGPDAEGMLSFVVNDDRSVSPAGENG